MVRRKSAVRIGVTGLGMKEEIVPGVFINTHYRGCTPGFVHTEEGIVLVDAPLIPKQAMDWRQQIDDAYPDDPLIIMVNTDHHRGHALGNQYFMPVKVIAHERAHKEMSGYTENFKERVRNSFKREPEIQVQLNNIIIVPPHITFTQEAELIYGSRKIKLMYVGGHTPATSIVWLEEEGVCFVGDILWIDQHPYMAQANSLEWLDALDKICALDAEYLVPGHGPVCTAEATVKVGEYIRFMRGRVHDYYLEGKTKNETKSGLVGELLEWFPVPPERKAKIESQIKSGLNRVYREIQKEAEDNEPVLTKSKSSQNGTPRISEDTTIADIVAIPTSPSTEETEEIAAVGD